MPSIDVSALTAEFPEETSAVQKLAVLLNSDAAARMAETAFELTGAYLYDQIRPSSTRVLAKILSRLVQQGVLQKIIRVKSDADEDGGARDFNAIEDVPSTLLDVRKGVEVRVNLERIQLIYRLERPVDTQ